MKYENKEQVVGVLVEKFDQLKSTFYNTPTNQQREKFWTFNRCLQYLAKLEHDSEMAYIGQLEQEDFDKRDIGF